MVTSCSPYSGFICDRDYLACLALQASAKRTAYSTVLCWLDGPSDTITRLSLFCWTGSPVITQSQTVTDIHLLNCSLTGLSR